MGTHIIAVACAKGGCTKTTTSMQLAGILHKQGYKTVVLDADNTGGATKWAMIAAKTGQPVSFPVTPVNKATLDRNLIRQQYPDSWVFIDTPPSDTGTIQLAIDCADVTIIPAQPSVMDLQLAGDTYRATPNAVVLLTRVRHNTILTTGTLQELDDSGITRFDTTIKEKEAIKRMAGTSETDKLDYPDVARELVEYVNSLEEE